MIVESDVKHHNPNTSNTKHLALEIHVLAWDIHKNIAGFNQLIGFEHPPLIIGSTMQRMYL
jgi:hypothetical protein